MVLDKAANLMTFAGLANRHPGETITICGTGPSLDALDFASLAGPRILLHRAGFVVPASPGETYWMVLDDCWGMGTPGPWHETLAAVTAGTSGMVMVCRDPLGATKRPVQAPVGANIIRFDGSRPQNADALSFTREQLAERRVLWTWSGSAAPAIHLAWFMGARKVVLAGCDGGDGHARCLDAFYESNRNGGWGYLPAHDCMIQALAALDIECEMIGAPQTATAMGEGCIA